MPSLCLIVTATIKPIEGIYCLSVTDISTRKRQYIKSLRYAINYYEVEKIIFCENSGSVDQEIYSLKNEAKEKGKTLEIISFIGNSCITAKKGKGYGEGEIIKYARDNSKIIGREDYIIKLTGRLIVSNLNEIILKVKDQDILINKLSVKDKKADTRFYIVKQSIYENFIEDLYLDIDDRNDLTMEILVYNCIVNRRLKAYPFYVYPKILGISGSTGQEYAISKFKYLAKNILNMIRLYTIK